MLYDPFPSCPLLFNPQQYTSPDTVSAHVWLSPVATSTAVARYCIGVGVSVGVGVIVTVGVGVSVDVGVRVVVGVADGVAVLVAVGVREAVALGVMVEVAVAVLLGVRLGVELLVAVGVRVAVLVAVGAGPLLGPAPAETNTGVKACCVAELTPSCPDELSPQHCTPPESKTAHE